jgi:hypothetical protein
MPALIHLFIALISHRFKSRHRLEIENLYLRHQLNIAMRRTGIVFGCDDLIERCWSG